MLSLQTLIRFFGKTLLSGKHILKVHLKSVKESNKAQNKKNENLGKQYKTSSAKDLYIQYQPAKSKAER